MNHPRNIILRAIEPEDLLLLYQLENTPEVWEVGVTNVPYSKYVLADYITNVTYDIYKDLQVRLIIEKKDVGVVGIADITNFDPKHLRAELGIVILKEHRRKGYATETIVELCQYAKKTLHLHQLYVVVDKSNEAAVLLFQKTFFEEGIILKDWLFDGEKYRDAMIMQTFL